MGKSSAQREYDQADRAFRKAWKLLDRIERRLDDARAEERKRVRQLGDGNGPDAAHRAAQLEVARAEVVEIERLLTELTDLIARHARTTTGQTVQDVATSVAAEIKDEAAEAPVLSTPATRRNRHHRPRRRPAEAGAIVGTPSTAAADDEAQATPPEPVADQAGADVVEPAVVEPAVAEAAEPAVAPATRRNRHHRPRRRPAEGADAAGMPAEPEAFSEPEPATPEPEREPEPEPVAASEPETPEPEPGPEPAAATEPEASEPETPEPEPEPEPVAASEPEASEPEPEQEAATEPEAPAPEPEPEPEAPEIAAVEREGHEPEAASAPEPEAKAMPVEGAETAGAGEGPGESSAPETPNPEPIIELPSPAIADGADAPGPPEVPQARDPWDNVEWSEPADRPESGGSAEA